MCFSVNSNGIEEECGEELAAAPKTVGKPKKKQSKKTEAVEEEPERGPPPQEKKKKKTKKKRKLGDTVESPGKRWRCSPSSAEQVGLCHGS